MSVGKTIKNKIVSHKEFLENYANGIKFQIVLELDLNNDISISNYINHINLLISESHEVNKILLDIQSTLKNK